ncbi:hypothetical protein HT031_004967 [Scenedesmus sp. PABB004]|nr:hypothetical protein HT031_004967 [Scenedesmus sp. PABB004]
MAAPEDEQDDKPWRRLYHAQEVEEEEAAARAAALAAARAEAARGGGWAPAGAAEQQQQPGGAAAEAAGAGGAEGEQEEELGELQAQLLLWYRKTCLAAGVGMGGACWHWYARGRRAAADVFLPPRAAALPPAVIEAWRRKAQMREGMRTVGRHTLFVTGVAALYFGVELGAGLARGAVGDWPNTAAAGAVAGGFLGARAPSSMRGRTLAMGTLAGGLLGALSGWSQQRLAELAAENEAGYAQQQQQRDGKPDS